MGLMKSPTLSELVSLLRPLNLDTMTFTVLPLDPFLDTNLPHPLLTTRQSLHPVPRILGAPGRRENTPLRQPPTALTKRSSQNCTNPSIILSASPYLLYPTSQHLSLEPATRQQACSPLSVPLSEENDATQLPPLRWANVEQRAALPTMHPLLDTSSTRPETLQLQEGSLRSRQSTTALPHLWTILSSTPITAYSSP